MKYIKLLLILVLVAVLLFFFLKNVDFRKVSDIISSVNLVYPVVFLLGLYVQYFIRAYRWKLILKPHKEHIRILTLYSYTTIGFFLSTIIPGKVGEPAKGILMAGEEKISRSLGLASVVLERLIDAAMIVLMLIVSLFFIKGNNTPFLENVKFISLLVLPFLVSLFFLFYYLNTEKAFGNVEKFIRFISKIIPARIREKAVSFSLNFVKGLRLDLSLWGYVRLLITSFIVWAFLIPVYWFFMRGFAFGEHIGLIESVPYFCIIVTSAAIPTPGLAGSFDAVSQVALQKLYSVDLNSATAYTILAHFLILVVMTVPGMIAFWSKGIDLKTIKNIKETKKTENNNKENNNNEMS